MIALILLLPSLIDCLSWAATLSFTPDNYKRIDLAVPKIEGSQVLYAIRDLSSRGEFAWNITHDLAQYNQTHDKLVFNVAKWPPQLQSITYDILISAKGQNFRVQHINITQYQTHIPFHQHQYREKYSIVLLPTGFSKSTITMGFMWMPVDLSQIYVIHYMDHMMGTETNNQNFGSNWITFCVVFVKRTDDQKIIKINRSNEYKSLDKSTHVPYFVGLQKIHSSNANLSIRQSISTISYISENVQAVAIPFKISHLLDTRTYDLPEKVSISTKLISLGVIAALLGTIAYLVNRRRTKFVKVWPASTTTELGSNPTSAYKHNQLVETD